MVSNCSLGNLHIYKRFHLFAFRNSQEFASSRCLGHKTIFEAEMFARKIEGKNVNIKVEYHKFAFSTRKILSSKFN